MIYCGSYGTRSSSTCGRFVCSRGCESLVSSAQSIGHKVDKSLPRAQDNNLNISGQSILQDCLISNGLGEEAVKHERINLLV